MNTTKQHVLREHDSPRVLSRRRHRLLPPEEYCWYSTNRYCRYLSSRALLQMKTKTLYAGGACAYVVLATWLHR